MSSIKLYYDPLSQPSRSVKWFLTAHAILHTDELVIVARGDQNKPEYLDKNPYGAVPCIEVEGAKILTESGAILTYLASMLPTCSAYPTDPFIRAKIHEALLRHETSSRQVTLKLLVPIINLKRSKAVASIADVMGVAANGVEELKPFIWIIEKVLGSSLYVAGTASPTIADYLAVCEFNQIPVMAPVLPPEFGSLASHPNIRAWMERMKSLPGHEEALAPLRSRLGAMLTA